MCLEEKVKIKIADLKQHSFMNPSLERAERLAEKYKEVQPQPFSYPVERALGLPTFDYSSIFRNNSH